MPSVFLGLGEYCIARQPGVAVKTYALGSCVALCLLNPGRRVYAMAHVVMADSIAMPERAQNLPCYFADTALPVLLKEISPESASQRFIGHGFVAKLAGGANVLEKTCGIEIGKLLLEALTRQLDNHRIPIVALDVGGSFPRNVFLNSTNGEILVVSPGKNDRLL